MIESRHDAITAIGTALFFWQGLEAHTAHVFRLLLLPAAAHKADVIFYSIKGYEARLSLTNSLAELTLGDKDLQAAWRAAHSELREALSLRHTLSHHTYQLNFQSGTFVGPIFNNLNDAMFQAPGNAAIIKHADDAARYFSMATERLEALRKTVEAALTGPRLLPI